MKKQITILLCICLMASLYGCSAQFDLSRAASAGMKTLQAATLSDAYIENYVGQYVQQLDAQSTIATGNDPYAVRMQRIAGNIDGRDGINIKVYKTKDVNAFAVADGSVRVYSGLMDVMSDEEILGVIGHEIGHIKLKHTKEAFKRALMTSALRDGIASTGNVAAALSDSQLGEVGAALVQSQYSQKQEYAADDYGYQFLRNYNLNPWAMALSFEKLRQMQEQAGSTNGAIQQLFSTHPDIEARTKRMAQQATKDGFAKPGATGTTGTATQSSGSTSTKTKTATPTPASSTTTPASSTSSKWKF